MKKRKDDLTDAGRKKKGIFGMALAAIAVMSITIFASCGYQPYEANVGQITGQAAEQTTEQAAEQTWVDEKQENENLTPKDTEENAARTYDPEDYGRIVEIREEFTNENTEEITFYYEMENFYVNEAFENGDKINDTLQKIYDKHEQGYKKYAETRKEGSGSGESGRTPYDWWHLLRLTFVGEQYISIVYNDIAYMGGAHPYSYFEGITIDCKTGEEVSSSELLGKSDEDILKQVSEEMGMDMVAFWDAIDFYLTDSKIVFFYRMPNYWDDVVWERQNTL